MAKSRTHTGAGDGGKGQTMDPYHDRFLETTVTLIAIIVIFMLIVQMLVN
jgi:hypothetical protein